jgi:alpha-glucoside transport system permease protein
MSLTRAALPVAVGALAALIFALLDPSGGGDLTGRLHWASLGGVLFGLGSFIATRSLASRRTVAAGAAIAATAVLAFLVLKFTEKSDRLASTMFSVVLAVSLIAGIWILLNLLVENARKNWAIFSSVSAAITAAAAFAIMRGNLSLKSLVADEDPALFGAGSGFLGHVEWPIFGVIVWGIGVFVMRQFDSRLIRVAIGVGLGLLTGWQIGENSLLWQRPAISWVSALLWTLVGAVLGGLWRVRNDAPTAAAASAPLRDVPVLGALSKAGFRLRSSLANADLLGRGLPGVLTGAIVGFTFAVWFRSDFIGSGTDVILAAAIPLAILGTRIAWNDDPDASRIASFENRAQALIFLGPALLFLSSALVIPAFRTIFLSTLDRDFDSRNFEGNTFDGFNAEGDAFIGFDNYRELWNDVDTFQLANWRNIFTSQLFWVALALLVVGVVAGLLSGTKQNGQTSYIGTGSSVGSIAFGGLLLAFAVFSVLRGTFFNNLWWVVTVTTLSVVLGLTIAVLSERAGRFESVAKSLIFMPMAISFVGASIVWRLQYQPRDITKNQTGVLNALWVQLGKLSHSTVPRIIGIVLLGILLLYIIYKGYIRGTKSLPFGHYTGFAIVVGYLFVELIRRSLGGFQFGPNGEVLPDTIVFLQEPPFNNVFLMVILIWIQTGFAMVILSAAIKAVPQELIEAARVDGASESQSFFQVVLPQILPTIGVVATTLIVLVTKVFDIVKVSTGGNFGTNVLANDMFEVSFSFANFTLGSAIAVFILVSVLPVMFLNVRRMQKARA